MDQAIPLKIPHVLDQRLFAGRSRRIGRWQHWALAPALLILATGCSQEDRSDPPQSEEAADAAATAAGQPRARQTSSGPADVSLPRSPQTERESQLQQDIRQLGRNFGGELGIAVRDLESGWTAHFNGHEYFPQQSVSKLWVAIAVLDQVDRGKLDLSQEVTVQKQDLTVFYQPIRPLVLGNDGYTTTLGDLLERAIIRSDNTANDFLLRRVGGSDVVREILARKGLKGIRFGPGERELQSSIAGLEWKPGYSLRSSFVDARAEVPLEKRRAAFEDYLEDPVDGATPIGVADALGKLKKGQLLSPASTDRLLSIMDRTRSGPRRLSGGLEAGWTIAHKTGTGQILEGTQAGYNDVGLVTSPNGRSYSVVVLIGRTSRPVPERMSLMQDAVGAVIEYDRSRGS